MNNNIFIANLYKKLNEIIQCDIFYIQKFDTKYCITQYYPKESAKSIIFNIDNYINNNSLKYNKKYGFHLNGLGISENIFNFPDSIYKEHLLFTRDTFLAKTFPGESIAQIFSDQIINFVNTDVCCDFGNITISGLKRESSNNT